MQKTRWFIIAMQLVIFIIILKKIPDCDVLTVCQHLMFSKKQLIKNCIRIVFKILYTDNLNMK